MFFSKKSFTKNTDQEKRENQPLTLEQLVEKTLDMLISKMNHDMPETGSFQTISMALMIPDTDNYAVIMAECGAGNQDERTVRVYVVRCGTDRAYNYFMKSGSSGDIKAYLTKKDISMEFANAVRELSKSVDHYWE